MKYCFGVDIGGTTVKLGLFSEAGAIVEKWEIVTRTENEGAAILPDVAEAINGKLEQHGIEKEQVLGIGVGVPAPVTVDGIVNGSANLGWKYKNAKKELEELKTVGRREVAEKIKVALSFGDLSENSEYDEAKNDQAILEARIADLEIMVSNARVIEKENLAADTVHIGSSVFVKTKRADGSEAERSFSIVGSNEANPRQGKISDESAVGKALVGAKVGQTVEVETPAGIVEYTIISVS